MDYGYIRVSSTDQNESRQMIALRSAGVPAKGIFLDKQSGKDFDRPQYKGLIKRLKEGDCLYIKSIDRLGRNYKEIIEQWSEISKKRKADIVVLDMPLLDTRRCKDLLGTFISDMVLQVLSFVAENERVNIRQRQAEGIAAAKLRGVKFGRIAQPLPEGSDEVLELLQKGRLTNKEAAVKLGFNVNTLRYRLRQMNIKALPRLTDATDLIGKKIGRLTVVEIAHGTRSKTVYRCKCDCGGVKLLPRSHLLSGTTRSCGCLLKEFLGRCKEGLTQRRCNPADLIGAKIGELTVISIAEENGANSTYNCRYDDGGAKIIKRQCLHGKISRIKRELSKPPKLRCPSPQNSCEISKSRKMCCRNCEKFEKCEKACQNSPEKCGAQKKTKA